jgi:hypothetical protein
MRRIVMQWLPILGLLGCAAVVLVQSRTIRQLRNENAELRNQEEAPKPELPEAPAQQASVDEKNARRAAFLALERAPLKQPLALETLQRLARE